MTLPFRFPTVDGREVNAREMLATMAVVVGFRLLNCRNRSAEGRPGRAVTDPGRAPALTKCQLSEFGKKPNMNSGQ